MDRLSHTLVWGVAAATLVKSTLMLVVATRVV